MFIHFQNQILNSDDIRWIECSNLMKTGTIRLYLQNGSSELVDGHEAMDIVIRLCPDFLEGKQARYARHAWSIHNLIGHPLMQICAWLHLTSLGIKIHDATIPDPKEEF